MITLTQKKEILNKLTSMIDAIRSDLPYGIDTIEDFDNLAFAPDAVYCKWCDSTFLDEDEAIDILKEDLNAFRAACKGFLDFEDCPSVYNDYSGSLDDGAQNFDNIYSLNQFKAKIEELKEYAEELDENYINIKSFNFNDPLFVNNLSEYLEELLDEEE